MKKTYVIKRGSRQTEPFDPLKLHASIVAACRAVRAHGGEANHTAEQVCKQVIDWLATKAEVTSDDIRRVASKHLATYHPEASYMYQNMNKMV